MALYYDVRLDISADKVIDSGYHFTQGDSTQIYMRVAVMDGAKKFDATNATSVRINFKKADGTFVEGTPTLTGDVYQYQFLGNEISCPGTVLADIKFYYDSGRVSSGMFTFKVDSDTSSDYVIQSTGYIDSLEEAKNQANQILGSMQTSDNTIKGYVDITHTNAVLAESYAKGGTGTRGPDEDTDNAKYYAEQSEAFKDEAYDYTQLFKYVYVRYSANADGSNMTATPQEDSVYIGIYAGIATSAPSDYKSYTWSRNRGYDGTAYFATFDIQDGELIMSWNDTTSNINFQLNEITGELEVVR